MSGRRVLGVDFTSAPRRAKPITAVHATLIGGALELHGIEALESFAAFELLLARPGPWIGGFDFPFGMPLELLRDLGWPRRWRAMVRHCAGLSRAELRAVLDTYRESRPAGARYAHRETDLPARSHSPMKLVNPPVALMFHEGAPRLAASGVHIPAHAAGDRGRVALEAYPGLLARAITRESYKSDTRAKQTAARAAARRHIVRALVTGSHPLALRLRAGAALLETLRADASGDALDAVLCAVQAGWAAQRPDYGLPRRIARCEGWILTAGAC